MHLSRTNLVGRDELATRLVQSKLRIAKRSDTIIRKLLHQSIFAIDDGRQIGLNGDRREPELARAFHQRHDFRRPENGFRRHAAAQNTQPA